MTRPIESVPNPLDGASNDTWDGCTMHNTTNGKFVISDKPGGVEGPNNKISSMESNKKWASLFATKLKGRAILPVPHKVDWDSGACSISIPDYIVDPNMAHMNLVLVGCAGAPKGEEIPFPILAILA